jgi:hypothetical protein
LRLLWFGLQAGLTEKETWKTTPGRIIDMFIWHREYDERLHHVKYAEGGQE